MSLKCRIYKDESGEIDFVEAANGSRSKLFDTLVNITGGNKNTALNLYALTEVEDFKDMVKAKVTSIKNRVNNLVKPETALATNLDTVKFSRITPTSTYFSNALAAVDNLTDRNPKNTQGWLKQLTDTQKNGGVKNVNQELEWIGLADYLNSYVAENNTKAGNIPSSVVEDYIKSNQIEIVDVSKGNVSTEIPLSGSLFSEINNGENISENELFKVVKEFGEPLRIYYIGEGKDMIVNIVTGLDNVNWSIEEYINKPKSRQQTNDTKYAGYQLKGGENYREVLLTMPDTKLNYAIEEYNSIRGKQKAIESILFGQYPTQEQREEHARLQVEIEKIKQIFGNKVAIENGGVPYIKEEYKSSHWDEGNILAHIRLNEKVLPNGDKVLVVNEIQSDWAQAGRKVGFTDRKLQIKNDVALAKYEALREELLKIKEEKKIDKDAYQRVIYNDGKGYTTNIDEYGNVTIAKSVNSFGKKLGDSTGVEAVKENNGDYRIYVDGQVSGQNNYYGSKEVADTTIERRANEVDFRKSLENTIEVEDLPSVEQEGFRVIQDYYSKVTPLERQIAAAKRDIIDIDQYGLQEMPYKNTDQWVGLATRRVLQMAAQEGYSGVAFATGQQSSSMYSLSNQVDAIEISYAGSSLFKYNAEVKKDGKIVSAKGVKDDAQLESFFGKEFAKKVVNDLDEIRDLKSTGQGKEYSGLDLEVGGEGMKSFYDNIVTKVAKKEAQRFDKNAKLEIIDFNEKTNVEITEDEDGGFVLRVNNKFVEYVDEETLLNSNLENTNEGARQYFEKYIPQELNSDKLSLSEQPYIEITNKMRSELKSSIPMFSRSLSETSKNEITQEVISKLELSGLANNVYQMTNAQIEAKLVKLGISPEVARQVIAYENAISIEEQVQFSKKGIDLNTAGFTYQGDVYLNTDVMGLDTPIHEFGHLHLDWLKENRTDLYKAGLSLVSKNKEEAKQYIDIVKNTQPDLEEGTEEFNNEVLAQVIGDQGAKLLLSNKKGSLSEWLKSVWEAIKSVVGLSNYTAEQVSAMTLAEFGSASATELLSGSRIQKGPNMTNAGVKLSVLSDYRDNIRFAYSDLIYPDVVFKDINKQQEAKVATNFYKKIVSKFNKTFDRGLKIKTSEKANDFKVTVEYETGLKPKYFAYPTATIGEHVTVDNIDKNVPLTSLRHELIHEMLVKNITDKFERINNLDNSANIDSIEEVQRNRAYNYTLEDVFFERVVENIERNPDNKDTFEVSTYGTDVINAIKKELGDEAYNKEKVITTLKTLLEGSNSWLYSTLLDIFENKLDYNVEDLSDLSESLGKMFKTKFVASKNIFSKDLQDRINDFTKFFNEEYTGVLTRLNKQKAKPQDIVSGNRLFNVPLEDATKISDEYMSERGMSIEAIEPIKELNTENSKSIAAEFDKMKVTPNDPKTKAAYKAMVQETIDQYKKILSYGYKLEINNLEPYENSADMITDLRDNKRMKIFSTESGFGDEATTPQQRKDNPLLQKTKFKDVNGQPLLPNDIFRFVHDFFGHAKFGNSFGPLGEENAWSIHSRMYSPLARLAMTTETRGQNSWVNFSGVNDKAFEVRDRARVLRRNGDVEGAKKLTNQVYDMMSFAEQKVGLLPSWISELNIKSSGERMIADVNGSKVYFRNEVNPITEKPTGKIEMELVETPEEFRGQGRAREAFNTALKYTDSIGKSTVLTISSRDKSTTNAGLEKFYTSLGYKKTSDFEMQRPARNLAPKGFDENGEPSIKDLMEYKDSSKESLSLEEQIAARNTAIALGAKSSSELLAKLESAITKSGIISFNLVSLQRGGVFNKYEASKIMNSKDLQISIKDAFLKLKNTEPFELEYDKNFIAISGTGINIFGKQEVENPFIVEEELAKDISGIPEQDIADNLLPSLGNKYTSDTKFRDTVNSIASNNMLTTVKVVVDGLLEDKTLDVRSTVANTLIDTENEELAENIRFINEDISEETWEENPNLIVKVLEGVKKQAINSGIDLRDISTRSLSNSREDILYLLDTLENLLGNEVTEENLREFSVMYKEFFEIDNVETQVIKTDNEFDTVVESGMSEYQLFKNFGLVKKQGDIYRQTEEQSLDELYDAMLEYPELLPEEIVTVEELKDFVEKEVTNLEISDYEIDPDNLAKMYLYKKFFGFPVVSKPTKVSTESLNKVTSSPEYLITEFVKEFNKWVLDTDNKYFTVTNRGIELVQKDPLSKEEAILTVPEEFVKDLSEYDAISKNLNLGITSNELVFEDYDTQTEQREFFANNPESVKKISGDYLYIEEGVLAVKNETDTFVRTPKGVFEMIYEAGNVKFYNKLPSVDPNFKLAGLEKPLSDVNFNKYQYLENTPEVFKVAKNYYSKQELEQIDRDYFNCQ
jgi:predicted GNAT family acetyltransferase